MPYFKEANILFIHIPKTGGRELEKELCKKYESTWARPGFFLHYNLPHPYDTITLPHQFYNTLYIHRKKLDIDFENAKVFAFVRNPYDRVISDLLYLKFIEESDNAETVLEILTEKYIYNEDLDNHNQPQFKFISDEGGNLHKNIKIFRCENLNYENDNLKHFLGVEINMVRENVNKDYSKYLNDKSRKIIEEIYEKDFDLFHYKIHTA